MQKRTSEILFTLALIAVFVGLFVIAAGYPKQPSELPKLVSGAAVVLLLIKLFRLVSDPAQAKIAKIKWRISLTVFGIMAAFIALVYVFGMWISGAAMLYAMGLLLRAKSKVKLGIVIAIMVVGFYLIFVPGAGVVFPKGLLFQALGY
ncbi:MAG TPA: tripartite tricarboxylate transporter TctB family protein [Bacillota bacterium]|jgi:hypothetical protein